MSIKKINEGDIRNKRVIREDNIVLNMPSNHILNELNKNLFTTNSLNKFLFTTFINPLQHKSHSLNPVVLPYDHQEGETKTVIDSLFIELKGGLK